MSQHNTVDWFTGADYVWLRATYDIAYAGLTEDALVTWALDDYPSVTLTETISVTTYDCSSPVLSNPSNT